MGAEADRAVSRAAALADDGYAVETVALTGDGHIAARFDRAYGLAALHRALSGRRFDLVHLDVAALIFRRADSWRRLGVLCLQLLTLAWMLRLGPLHVAVVREARQPWPVRVLRLLAGISSADRADKALRAAFGPSVPSTACRGASRRLRLEWQAYCRHIAARSRLLAQPKRAAWAEAAASWIADAGDNRLATLLRRAADGAGRGPTVCVGVGGETLSRSDRAAIVALHPDPAWPGDIGGPQIARWMTHLVAHEGATSHIPPSRLPAAIPSPTAARASIRLAAFRLVSWAETAIAGRPSLATRRAQLLARRTRIEGVGAPGSPATPVGVLAAPTAELPRPPTPGMVDACLWRALGRQGFRVPLQRQPAVRTLRDADGVAATLDRYAGCSAAAAPDTGLDPDLGPWLLAVLAGGDPFKARIAPVPRRSLGRTEGQLSGVEAGGDRLGNRVTRHGRSGLLDPLSRGLLAHLARSVDAPICAAGPTTRWRRPLHLIDLDPALAAAGLIDGTIRADHPNAALVLLWGGSVSSPASEALALAMVDAVWCIDSETLTALRQRHHALPASLVSLGRDMSHCDATGRSNGESASAACSGPTLDSKNRPWRRPGEAEHRLQRLKSALKHIDVIG